MKKTLVFVLVAAMIVSMFAVNASALTNRALNTGNVKITAYEAATEWKPDGVIDTDAGEYYEIPLTAMDYTTGWDGTNDAKESADRAAKCAQEITTSKFYASWNGKDTVYMAWNVQPAILKQTLSSCYNPRNGAPLGHVGVKDDFCCNLAFVLITTTSKDKSVEGPNGNTNWIYMAYARALEEGEINPDDMPHGGMWAASWEPQFGCSNAYDPIGEKDFYIDYDLEAGTVTFELSFPMTEAWNMNLADGDEAYFSLCMTDGTEDYTAWGGNHYVIAIGDYGYFLDGSGGNCAGIKFVAGQDPNWTPAGEETTAADDETTVADDETTVADDETTAAPKPVNPTTADITVLCIAAAASAIAIISKKRK